MEGSERAAGLVLLEVKKADVAWPEKGRGGREAPSLEVRLRVLIPPLLSTSFVTWAGHVSLRGLSVLFRDLQIRDDK